MRLIALVAIVIAVFLLGVLLILAPILVKVALTLGFLALFLIGVLVTAAVVLGLLHLLAIPVFALKKRKPIEPGDYTLEMAKEPEEEEG
ncbi:MAG: hypothetical protein DRN96_03350 [Thermoproteota archaeon]|nr:MAG: hypothetical protein DRN96_03350 [Candidatus Korarchaeota archaeon]